MKYRNLFFASCLVGLAMAASAVAQVGINRVEGRVTHKDTNMGVDNVYVELYSNLGTMVDRARTTGQGRFSFRRMGPGRYVVVAKPFGKNLREESVDIEINNQTGRSDTVYVDIRLRPERNAAAAEMGVVGTVFAQEVPADAKRLYKSGIDRVKSSPDRAYADLEAAVKLFPTYFDALAALGKAYVIGGKYEKGYPYLLRAIDINSKCSDCYYSLALSFYKLNELAAAVKAIDAAVVLQGQSSSVKLLQGIIYRLNKNLPGAEKALLTAKKLSTEPNPEVHWQLSLVYNGLERNAEAAHELELFMKAKSDMKDDEKTKVRDLIAKLKSAKPKAT